MSTLQEQFKKSQGLLSAVDAVTHIPSLVTIYSGYVLATLLLVGISWIAVKIMMYGDHTVLGGLAIALGILLSNLVALVGISATGILLNDKVRGREAMSIVQAIVSAIVSFPRLIGVLALLSILPLLAIVVVFIVIFVCKIPFVGPILLFVAFPVSVVFLGIVFYACSLLIFLAGPSIWSHNSIARTLSLMASIFRERLMSATVQLILLSLLVALVVWLIFFFILMVGGVTTSFISASILPMHLPFFELFDIFMNPSGLMYATARGAVGGYFIATIFGMLLLIGLAFCLGLLVAIAGSCIIFANATEGLSTAKMDEKLQGSLAAVRQNIDDARRRMNEVPTNSAAAASSALLCAQCSTPYQPGEMFCGNCGHKLG